MNLYLDDDSVHEQLIRLLRKAGHDVQIPADVARSGSHDAVHLTHAIGEVRILLSHNRRDFVFLHELVLKALGHHPGILIVGRDNDRRDFTPAGIVRALGNLIAATVPNSDHLLNHWR